MRVGPSWFAPAAVCLISGATASASAQEIGSTAPAVFAEDPEYDWDPLRVGPFTLEVGAETQAEYTSNVFAAPDDAEGDVIGRVRTFAKLQHVAGALTTTFTTRLNIRRYADFSSENAEAGSAVLTSEWRPREGETLFVSGLADRVIEDRGDPESRRADELGPRIYRILGGSAGYSRRGSRFLVEVLGDIQNVNALDPEDDDRDYDSYSGRATVGFRPGGPFYFTGTGYYTRRNFRLREAITNVDRDVSTTGALLGVRFTDGGLIEGGVGAGIFHLSPDDPTRDSRTGFSMQGRLTYRPAQRTAINVNLFNGDVTSFRSGGSTRTETTIGVSVDQEVRHNLLASAGVEWERSNFVGSIVGDQDRVRVTGGAEYLLNRRISLFSRASYRTRSSDDPLDEYSRFQMGVGVRMRF